MLDNTLTYEKLGLIFPSLVGTVNMGMMSNSPSKPLLFFPSTLESNVETNDKSVLLGVSDNNSLQEIEKQGKRALDFKVNDPIVNDHFIEAESSLVVSSPVNEDLTSEFSRAPGSEVYTIDDGSWETAIGVIGGGDMIWLNQFDTVPGSELITSIALAWGFVAIGTPTQVLLYEDPNDDGDPNDAVLLATANTSVSNTSTNLLTVPISPTTVNGSFFVGALITQDWDEYPAPLDEDPPTLSGRSWAGLGPPNSINPYNPPSLDTIESIGFPGNWLLRADSEGGSADAEWTFMVYLDGDNNLEGAGIDDFLEMATIGCNNEINIVVQFDRIGGYDTSYGNWTGTRRGAILTGEVPDLSWGIDMGELNMGDPNTLIDFTNWSITNYPAENYALVIWDHGGGWRDDTADRGVAWDDTNGGDYLETREVGQALAAIPEHIDLFGQDACLMSMIECAHEVKDEASVFVGSERTEPWDGWPYDTILSDLVANPYSTPQDLGTIIVDRYGQSYAGNETQSAVDLWEVNYLSSSVSQLASAIINDANNYDRNQLEIHRNNSAFFSDINYRDLGTFLDNVAVDMTLTPSIRTAALTALTDYNNAIIANHSGPGLGGTGLSIYFQQEGQNPDADYNSSIIDFAASTQWDEFLNWWSSSTPNPDEPNDTIYEALETGLPPNIIYNYAGEIGDNLNVLPEQDVDMFELQLNVGDRVTIDIDADLNGSYLDSILRLFYYDGSSVMEVTFSDDDPAPDEPPTLDSYIDFTAIDSGTYYVGISNYDNFDYDPEVEGSGSGSAYNLGDYDLEIQLTSNIPNSSIILQSTDNTSAEIWFMDGATIVYDDVLPPTGGLDIVASGDFNSDGNEDLVLQNTSGLVTIQFLDANSDYLYEEDLLFTNGLGLDAVAVGDFNNDNQDDLVLQSPNYTLAGIVLMDGTNPLSGVVIPEFSGLPLDIQGAGDFNADGEDDLLVQASDYSVAGIVFMNGTDIDSAQVLPELAGLGLDIAGGVKDYNYDGNNDFILQSPDNSLAGIVYMNGSTINSAEILPSTGGFDIVA